MQGREPKGASGVLRELGRADAMQSTDLVLLSGQEALGHVMDIVANNVANSNTTGFKREGIEFDTLLEQPAPGQTLNFVVDRATYRDAAVGPIEDTGNQLDLAIQGSGYFQVQMPDGSTGYTRNGSFQVNSEGQITTHSGLQLLSDGGAPIDIPQTTSEINVSSDGFISARIDNNTNLAQLGKIGVVQFDNEQQMQPKGAGIYTTAQVPQPAVQSAVVQGALEQSNVHPVTEMTNLIQVQRLYEEASNLISQENTRLNNAINTLSKTTT
jgi:flagellar basal-body rod protein FlgF